MNESTTIKTPKMGALFACLLCGLGVMFYFYEYILREAPAAMTTELMSFYHLNAAKLGHLVAFYYYILAPMQLPIGLLMDRYGPRRLLTFGSLCCAMGSYLFAVSHYVILAEFGRFLVGFGSAFAFVGVMKLATIFFPPQRFAFVSGLTIAFGQIAAMVGAILMTFMVAHEGWRLTNYIMAGVGVVLAVMMFLVMRNEKYCTETAKETEKDFKSVFAGFTRIILNPQIWINGMIGCLLYLPTSVFAELWGIPYLKVAYHFTSMEAARVVSMIFLGWAIGGPIVGLISDHIRQRRLPLSVGATMAAILLALVFFLPNYPHQWVGLTFFIFGMFSSAQIITFPIGRELSSQKLAGTAIALTNMLCLLGAVIFQPLVGMMLDMNWSGRILHGVHVYTLSNYQLALSVLPLGLVLAVLLTFCLQETRCKISSS